VNQSTTEATLKTGWKFTDLETPAGERFTVGMGPQQTSVVAAEEIKVIYDHPENIKSHDIVWPSIEQILRS